MWKKVSMVDENLVERCKKREENVYYRLVDYLEIDEDNMWREGDIDYLEDMKKEDWENNIEKNEEEIEVLERMLKEIKMEMEWNKRMLEKME
ncbi:MAG: hypothetical protein PHT97_10905 [Methanoculleus sp.]|uniref:hypothetical protein n=1 Tax=Methanoculleus sp. TaxID=90427 RepID=UPI00260ABFF9|nr:hypothetical protein [Methanoculleus sp.]MDD2255248.1 hypothetical protein [Methanoculleus sp.]MDD4471650.1 hypothetical protein [Methanoculleus sp.]